MGATLNRADVNFGYNRAVRRRVNVGPFESAAQASMAWTTLIIFNIALEISGGFSSLVTPQAAWGSPKVVTLSCATPVCAHTIEWADRSATMAQSDWMPCDKKVMNPVPSPR